MNHISFSPLATCHSFCENRPQIYIIKLEVQKKIIDALHVSICIPSNQQKPLDKQPITRIPASLSQQQRKLLTDLPDLGKIQMWAKDSVVKLQLQVSHLGKQNFCFPEDLHLGK